MKIGIIGSINQFANVQRTAEQLGGRIGALLVLAELPIDLEESILASLPYLSLEEIKAVHDALEARVFGFASQSLDEQFEASLALASLRYQEKQAERVVAEAAKFLMATVD